MASQKFTIGIMDFTITEENRLELNLVDREKLIEIAKKHNMVFTLGFFVGSLMQGAHEIMSKFSVKDSELMFVNFYSCSVVLFEIENGEVFKTVLDEFEQYAIDNNLLENRKYIPLLKEG